MKTILTLVTLISLSSCYCSFDNYKPFEWVIGENACGSSKKVKYVDIRTIGNYKEVTVTCKNGESYLYNFKLY